MASPQEPEPEHLHNSEGDTPDLRVRLIAAAAARAESSGDNEPRKQAEEHQIRQTFRRLLNPGIIRPNSDQAASSAIKVRLHLVHLLRDKI